MDWSMHSNRLWLTFLGIVTFVVLWFTVRTGYEVYLYNALDEKTPPKKINWSVMEKSKEHYVLLASYTYFAEGYAYNGETILADSSFRNRTTASKKIGPLSQKSWIVWYNSSNPKHSTIQKSFPTKSCSYTVIMWGILFYFVWLGFYVGKHRSFT